MLATMRRAFAFGLVPSGGLTRTQEKTNSPFDIAARRQSGSRWPPWSEPTFKGRILPQVLND